MVRTRLLTPSRTRPPINRQCQESWLRAQVCPVSVRLDQCAAASCRGGPAHRAARRILQSAACSAPTHQPDRVEAPAFGSRLVDCHARQSPQGQRPPAATRRAAHSLPRCRQRCAHHSYRLRSPTRECVYHRDIGVRARAPATNTVRLDHGRRWPAPIPSLGTVARDISDAAHCRRRSTWLALQGPIVTCGRSFFPLARARGDGGTTG